MGILKVKDWANSGKQFIVKEEDGGQIISVERIVDSVWFRINQMVFVRSVEVQGNKLDTYVIINQFLKDGVHVELMCEAFGYPFSKRIGITEINKLEAYSSTLVENLIKEMDESFKKRLEAS